MATKSVTLKDSNGDTLYPVTDSNVVNISQQKTLAQALDGVVYAEDPTQNATPTAWVTSGDIDWTNILTDSTAFKLSDYGGSSYLDNRNDGWSGYNLISGTAFGACTRLNGSWAKDAIGGGMTMTDSLISGVYYVTSEINGDGVGIDGYKPFRFLHNGSALTGDLGFPQRGGGISSSFFVSLKPGDTLTLQIYCTNDGKTYSMRIWTRGYLVRPAAS